MSTQGLLIKAEIAKGSQIISALEDHINVFGKITSQATIKNLCARIFHNSQASCILIIDSNLNEIYYIAKKNSPKNKIKTLTQNSIKSAKKNVQFSGITWGVFWKQNREVIISAPIYHHQTIAGGASIMLSLDSIYFDLRQTQSIILTYILINICFLTLFGLYRFSRIFVKPLQNLLERAEKFQDDDELFFSNIKGSNEFSQLSRALNRMLYRISESKKELKETVISLEKANITLKQAQNDIINAEKLASVGCLSAGIAHEIGNPIAIVMGYLDLLKRNDISEDEKKDFIVRTGNEINRINSIIRQLLDLSRPSDGKKIKVSIHEIINEVVNMCRCQPLMTDINIKSELKSKTDTIMADPSQLRQIFLNLIMNASDAINSNTEQTKGKLLITTNMISDSSVEIMFSDNGGGIPEDAVNNIFDPFYTTKDPGKGTGLGLYVCYMIIDLMGGSIKAVNNEQGTNIIIHLPIYPSEKKYEY
ncbi:sensor histidine kinase [Desulfonema limicola]|nr:ATP-binding protein [Desulfonema limicola]